MMCSSIVKVKLIFYKQEKERKKVSITLSIPLSVFESWHV